MHTPCAAQSLRCYSRHRTAVSVSLVGRSPKHLPQLKAISPNLHGTHRPRTLLADDSRVARTHNPAVEQAVMTRGARGGTTGIALARARASPWPLAARAAFSPARIHRSGGRRCEDCGRATPPRAYDRAPGGARAECRRETSARLRTPVHAAERQRHHPRRAPTKRARGSPLRRPTAETLAPTPPRPRPAGPAPISRRTT